MSFSSLAFAQDDFDADRVQSTWVEWTNTERTLV